MSPAARDPVVFFQPSPATPVADVLGALEALAARGRGEVKDASELYPGLFPDSSKGAFLLRAAGHGAEYYERESWLALPCGFLHPALAPAVASLLGWTVDEALAVTEARAPRGEPGLQRRVQPGADGYSTVTLLARLRGWSTSFPRISATW